MRRAAPWLPLAASSVLGAGSLILEAWDPRLGNPTDIVLVPVMLTWAAAGGLVASRQPRNAVGWLLGATSLAMIGSFFIERYAIASLDGGLHLIGAGLAGAFAWTWLVALACPVVIAFLVPDGRPASPGWGRVLGVVVGLFIAIAIVFAVGDPTYDLPGMGDLLPNPIFVAPVQPLYDFVQSAFVIYVLLFGAAAIGLVSRFRQAHETERRQLEWIVASLVAMAVCITASNVVSQPLSDVCFAIAMSLLPIAIGIAILRYRLWDIDRIVSRTIAWTLVTAVLVGAFAGLVLLLQGVLEPVIGGGTLAVAASTLVVAALFQPLRTRVQHAVDRRFDRARYDGERLALAFAARLRDEVGLDAIHADVLGTVDAAVRPAHAALWLRSGGQEAAR